MYLSDALSRLSSHNTKQGKQTDIKGLNISIHDVETEVKDSTLNRICCNTKTESTLSLVIRYVLEGWPGTTNECVEPAHAYFIYRKELAIIDGLLAKGNCIVFLLTCAMTVLTLCMLHTLE